jgi:hypothetical protein
MISLRPEPSGNRSTQPALAPRCAADAMKDLILRMSHARGFSYVVKHLGDPHSRLSDLVLPAPPSPKARASATNSGERQTGGSPHDPVRSRTSESRVRTLACVSPYWMVLSW